MRQTKVAAQAQLERQDQITAQESLELCKALLRVSIYHVSYLRGIFPSDHYKSVDMTNLDNMQIFMMLPKDDESMRLIQWVEGGVADALSRRYLRKVFFGFSKDVSGKDLLEEYVFNFSYDAEGSVHMEAAPGSKHKFSTKDTKGKGNTLNQVKYQVCRLMRMLVEITHTLEQVPEERYLFMKLTYTDDTPDEYEPPMFCPAKDGGVGCFSRLPFVMEVGKVDTRHIKVGLAVKTILDNLEQGWEEDNVPVADDNSNLFLETATKAATTNAPEQEKSMGGSFSYAGVPPEARQGAGEVQQAAVEDMQRVDGPVQQGNAGAHTDRLLTQEQQQELDAVKSWVLGRPMNEVHVVDALARFTSVSAAALDTYFYELQKSRILESTGQNDCYIVNKPVAAADKANPAAIVPPAADNVQMAEAQLEKLTVAGMDSQEGGLHQMPGSQRTMSVVGKRKANPDPADENTPANEVFPETQPSQNNPVLRKASIVKDPIPQRVKRVRKATASVSAVQAAPQPQLRRSARNTN